MGLNIFGFYLSVVVWHFNITDKKFCATIDSRSEFVNFRGQFFASRNKFVRDRPGGIEKQLRLNLPN